MTHALWYWVARGVGVGFLLLSLVFGDLFDFIDVDLGDGFAATPVFFTIVAAFGGGGLLAIAAFEASAGVSVIAGLGASVVAGVLAAAFFRVLGKQEAGEGFSISELVGARARCTLAIRPGKEGRVAVQARGMTRNLTAVSDADVAVGDEVVVLDALGSSLKVGRAETSDRTPS
jgi:membrane protein implicated in regulation of membrane protease activity